LTIWYSGADSSSIGASGSDGADQLEPLVYVDGIRLAGGAASLDALDPDRIERIEVLKGAAALEVFGAEAAGGVVQIYLKPTGGAP
jgi:vitamin B12 transporter